jgi:hypothetical protein
MYHQTVRDRVFAVRTGFRISHGMAATHARPMRPISEYTTKTSIPLLNFSHLPSDPIPAPPLCAGGGFERD